MKSYIFSVVIEPDTFEDGREAFLARCPALNGCQTWGHTAEEALANIQEAVQLYVEDMMEEGDDVVIDPEKGAMQRDTPTVVVNVG